MRPLLLVSFLACAACSPDSTDAPTRRKDARHDLVTLAPFALESGIRRAPQPPDVAVDFRDDRDRLTLVRCPAGQSITYPPLTVSGAARLSVGCGSSSPPGTAKDPRTVRYLVEATRVDDAVGAPAEPVFVQLAERLHTLAAIEADGPKLIDVLLPAGGAGDGGVLSTWVLRLSTQRWITQDGPPRVGRRAEVNGLDWPAFLAPTLASSGRQVPLAADPVVVRESVQDLVAGFASGTVMQEDSRTPVAQGSILPQMDVAGQGGLRDAIEVRGRTRVRFLVQPERTTTLEWSVAVDCQRGWELGGDGMLFAVEVDGERLWERFLDPVARREQRNWQAGSADLSRFAGREVALDLVTDVGHAQDTLGDVGGWASAHLMQERNVPRLAAGDGPDIVLIIIDTLRADRLGSGGHRAGLTPHLDALAAQGTVFLAARSPASWTWPSTASILTGLAPPEHGVHDWNHCVLSSEFDTLAELAQRKGYTTGAFVANMLISRGNQFDQGFETFSTTTAVTARALNHHAVNWLHETGGVARFLYLHYFDPHAPYSPPKEFLMAPGVPSEATDEEAAALDIEGLRLMTPDGKAPPEFIERYITAALARYEAEVTYVDTAIGELLDELAAHSVLDDAIVVVTSDHGEEFWEHEHILHGYNLYEETVRVPLIITTFGSRFDGLRLPPEVLVPVTTRDIAPTLIALAGLPAPADSLPGSTLLPDDPADMPPPPIYAETLIGTEPGVKGTLEKLAAFDGRWKLVSTPLTGRLELYDLRNDPGELQDLAEQESERRDALHAVLRAGYPGLGAAAGQPGDGSPESEAAIERMQALGYLGK